MENHLKSFDFETNFSIAVYVDVESSLDRKLYLSVLAASTDARAFNIRISQVNEKELSSVLS